jgi:iron complex transport system permease protein
MSGTTHAVADVPPATRARPSATALFLGLGVALVLCAVAAATVGAAGIPFRRLVAALGLGLGDGAGIERDQLILWTIRFPRIVMALIVGALLATAGTMMQGLFRNPLADPALLGISSGAALAAAVVIVFGDKVLIPAHIVPPMGTLPVAAFFGALLTSAALYRFATREGRTSIATLLLSGLAIGALANAAIGFLIFTADDRQLRDITFWMLGSLSGATWGKLLTLVPFLAAVVLGGHFIARSLDLFVMGEAEAFHSGVEVQRLKLVATVLVSAAAGAAVSVSGVIGFVGIIVPHLLRLVVGPGHRLLLPASALLGGILLLVADTLSRVIVAPAELPIGILTAIIGAPFFLVLLIKQRAIVGL